MKGGHRLALYLLFLGTGLLRGQSVPDSLRTCISQESSCDSLAELYLQLGKYWKNIDITKADSSYKKALRYSLKANNEIQIAKAQFGYGIIKGRYGQMDSAKWFYDRSLAVFKRRGCNVEQARVLNSLTLYYNYIGNYAKALEVANEATSLLSINDDLLLKVMLKNNKSLVYKKIGDYEEALKMAYEALAISRKMNDLLGTSKILGNIGLIHQALAHYELSIDYFQKSLIIREKIGEKRGLAYPLHNIGLVYEALKDYDKALVYYKRSLAIKREFNDKKGIARSMNNIGVIYNLKGNYPLALNNLSKSLEIKKKIGLYSGVPHTLNNLGDLFNDMKNYDKSNYFYKQALDTTLASIPVKEMLRAYEGLYENYKMQGDVDRALFFLEKKQIVNAKLLNEQTNKEIAKLEIKYQSKEMKAKNDKLQQQAHFMQKQVTYQSLVGAALLLSLVLVGVIAFIVNQRKKQKEIVNANLNNLYSNIKLKAKELELANAKLKELSQFKEDMTSMVVHDLKNPLNTLVNLMDYTKMENRDELLKHSVKQMLLLVSNLLEINKYENNEIAIDPTSCHLINLVKNAVEDVKLLAQNKSISIHITSDATYEMKIDIELIQRVMINLLVNAIKYSPQESKILIDIKRTDDFQVKCSVIDEGEGIATTIKDTLFDRYQGLSDIKLGLKSTGLGLAFSKIAVEAHQGTIGCVSEAGNGAEFWFTLPCFKEKVLQIEEVCLTSEKVIHLLKEDKAQLLEAAKSLNKLEVFQISEIYDVTQKITGDNDRIEEWIKELTTATENCNPHAYQKVIGWVLN